MYRPPRAHPESRLREALQAAWQTHKAFGLLGASLSDVPGIEGLMALLLDRGCSFSLSSLRMDAMNETLLDLLKGSGQKTLSMAPEAGSERLRRVINKHLTQEQMIETVRLISRKGDFSLRLYFLMGLPTETREDVKALVDLAKTLKHHMVKESSPRGHIRQIHLSVNCFVPKALTPFQWLPMESVNSLKEKQKSVAKALAREGGFRVNFDIPKWAFVQALLSLGDRRVGKILLLAHQNGGHWMQAFRLSDINPDFFVYRQKELDEVLPWDHLDHGLRKSHLIREYTLALKGEESEPCLVGQCFRCGACNDWP